MGCDIHAYLEHYELNDSRWVHCYAADIDLGRNYTMFNAMAGVRGMGPAVVDPRGIPVSPDISGEVFCKFYCKIVDEIPKSGDFLGYEPGYVLRTDADRYIKDYGCKELDIRGDKYIKNPDWHTPSFLHLKELIAVRRKYLIDVMDLDMVYKGKKRQEVMRTIRSTDDYEFMKCCFPELESPTLNATIASMIAIENSGPYKTRLVFWFDS